MEKKVKLQLFGVGQERKPEKRFYDFLDTLLGLQENEAIDAVLELLLQVNGLKNPQYLKAVFQHAGPFIEQHGFYLVDAVNTSLDYFMHIGDIKEAFRVLKGIITHGDSRTLEILRKYSSLYRDGSVVSRLSGYRNKLERKLLGIVKKLEQLEMEPIVDPYQEWQGEVHA